MSDPKTGPGTGWLRTRDVAELLKVSPKTVTRWAKEGKLPHQRTLGEHRRYPEDDIKALAADLADQLDQSPPEVEP